MADAKTDALARVPLFRHCSRHELDFLASRADEVDLGAGRTLIRQGEPADSFYVLLDGEVTVDVDGASRPAMRAGDFFGEISMLDRGPATATVVTASPVRAMVMSHAQFRDAIKGNDVLLAAVMTAMAERLRADQSTR